MEYLLDTHTFLWFINDSIQLSESVANLWESDVDLWLSVASLWEIAIKTNIGKLKLQKIW
jgi:PIN domain nuclease of toxin-antitoxin system